MFNWGLIQAMVNAYSHLVELLDRNITYNEGKEPQGIVRSIDDVIRYGKVVMELCCERIEGWQRWVANFPDGSCSQDYEFAQRVRQDIIDTSDKLLNLMNSLKNTNFHLAYLPILRRRLSRTKRLTILVPGRTGGHVQRPSTS